MPTLLDPYLSFIVAARNDDYAGGMLRRLQVCLDTFVYQAESTVLPSEVILVDWNSPAARPLSGALRWPAGRRWCSIRVITVPRQIHAKQRFGDRLPILIHRARNVGIRRAKGRFILPTSADILCSDELIAEIAANKLDDDAMYRIARHDVPVDALDFRAHDARIEFCRNHVQTIHERRGSYQIPGAPLLFTNGAGDFTLLSKDLYVRLNGIPEERQYHSMHLDSVFCYMAYAACGNEIVLREPCRIYHVDHGTPSWKVEPRFIERLATRLPLGVSRSKKLLKKLRARWPPRSKMDRRRMPYMNLATPAGRAEFESLVRLVLERRGAFTYNDGDWGLGNEALDELVIG